MKTTSKDMLLDRAQFEFAGETCNLCGCELLVVNIVLEDHIEWVGRPSVVCRCFCCGQRYALAWTDFPQHEYPQFVPYYLEYLKSVEERLQNAD